MSHSRFVTIYNAELDAYSEVVAASAHVWIDRGWILQDRPAAAPEVDVKPTAASATPQASTDATAAAPEKPVRGTHPSN